MIPPPKLTLPSMRIPLKPEDKRNVKAFRLPWSYFGDALQGYQLNAERFKVYRITPGLIPEGSKFIGVWHEHVKDGIFVMIEHPSFPEHTSGEPMEMIEITIDEIEVYDLARIGSPLLNPPLPKDEVKPFHVESSGGWPGDAERHKQAEIVEAVWQALEPRIDALLKQVVQAVETAAKK